jgi:hypothetical protein
MWLVHYYPVMMLLVLVLLLCPQNFNVVRKLMNGFLLL